MAIELGPMASLYRRMLEVMDWVNQNRLMLVSSSSLLMQLSSSPSTHRHIFSMIQASKPALLRTLSVLTSMQPQGAGAGHTLMSD